jgi:hypothetical protein
MISIRNNSIDENNSKEFPKKLFYFSVSEIPTTMSNIS